MKSDPRALFPPPKQGREIGIHIVQITTYSLLLLKYIFKLRATDLKNETFLLAKRGRDICTWITTIVCSN